MAKAELRRRELLARLGAASFLALPVFRDSIARAAGPPLAKRFVAFFLPGGVYWGPAQNDPMYGMSWDRVMAPLAPLKSEVILFQNLKNGSGELANKGNDNAHGIGTQGTLSGRFPVLGVAGVTSIDQVIGSVVGKTTRFTTMQLSTARRSGTVGANVVSYRDGFPMEPVRDPLLTFTRMFPSAVPPDLPPIELDDGDPKETIREVRTAPPKVNAARARSLLDFTKAEITAVRRLVDTSEGKKLDQHLDSLRELEKGVIEAACTPEQMQADKLNLPVLIKLQLDLLFQALKCDQTRVATFALMHSGDGHTIFPWLGVTGAHHGLQHESVEKSADRGEALNKVQAWFVSQIANFLERLRATPEGGGTMLDNSIVFFFQDMCSGRHRTDPMMNTFVAGRASGLFKTGRTLDCGGASNNDLLVTIANAMGVPLTTFGNPMFNRGPLQLG